MHLIAALPSFLTPSNLLAFGGAVFGLGIVIFVHELGHFLVAKACGVKCEKFYVGFDVPMSIGPIKLPAALWKKQWGETEYGIGIVPLGGYVKMLGQHDNPQLAAAEAEKARIQSENPDSDGDQLDPRSFPAKTVLQRMAIISAGVIFNLIFGLFFAALAFKMGVEYVPAEIGGTVPGDSAWKAGLAPGDKLVQFHRDGRRDEQLRWDDLKFHVFWMGDKYPLEALVKDADGAERWVKFQPKSREGVNMGMPMIGVLGADSLKVLKPKYDLHSICAKSDLMQDDQIVAVIVDGQRQDMSDPYAMQRLMCEEFNKPLEVVVDRPQGERDPKTQQVKLTDDTKFEQVTVALSTQPLRELGMTMKMGPIVAVQKGSPADAAGIQDGDYLLSIGGSAIADPLHVDELLVRSVGTPTTVTVKREDEEVELTVTPRPMLMTGNALRPGGPVSSETLGVAFIILDEIASVAPDGPAAKAGLQADDKISNVVFMRSEDGPVDARQFKRLGLDEAIEFSKETQEWAYIDNVLQALVPDEGIELKITYDRDGKSKSVDVVPGVSASQFSMTRGMRFWPPEKTRTSVSIADAFRLGWTEIKHGVLQVVIVLSKIGKTYKHLGGPLSIAAVATSEASRGIPALLLFLTMLSANLAVLNFLPIPVLDGGHIVFLLYEGIFGKPMNERIAFLATMVGLFMILALMLFALTMDVSRLPDFFAD